MSMDTDSTTTQSPVPPKVASIYGENRDKTAPATSPEHPRDDLARLLSRLAALQGQAVPSFRFAMLEKGRDGMSLDELPALEQAIEMWSAHFPAGKAARRELAGVDKKDFPLLWIEDGGSSHCLVRGQLSGGTLTAENANGELLELKASDLTAGHFLVLDSGGESADPSLRPVTASDWFAHAIRKHRKVFLEGVLATFVISTLALFTSLYTMQVYDRVVPTKGFSTLWVLTTGVALSILLEFMMKMARAWIVERASQRIDVELSEVFFGKAMSIRMDARPATVGTFASQLRQFESVRSFMTSSTLFILADAPFALFFVAVMAMIGGYVAAVPLVMIPVAVIAGLLASRKVKHYMGQHMAESNQKNGLLIEAIDGAESIKAADGGWKMQDRYRTLTQTMAENNIKLRHLSSRASYLTQAVQQVNYVALIAVGAYAITGGDLTMGGLIACSIISGRALGPIAQIPQLISQWANARIALDALDKIMELPGDREPDARLVIPERCDGQLRMEKVAFGYLENQPSLSIDSLSFAPGERVAVVGAVGSGKSTLIKLLSGLYKPKQGRIFLDGVDMEQLAPSYLREQIGYLPQDVRLFNGTLRENLTLGLPTPSDSRILQAAALTGLDQVIAGHPHGLELMISEGGRGLSGGQRQLVGLTRLLLVRPRIMLLDEPTASMDAQLEGRVVKHLFDEVPKDSVLVIVTHKPAVLPLVDRILVVDKGRVVMDDKRDKVLALMKQRQPAAARRAAGNPVTG